MTLDLVRWHLVCEPALAGEVNNLGLPLNLMRSMRSSSMMLPLAPPPEQAPSQSINDKSGLGPDSEKSGQRKSCVSVLYQTVWLVTRHEHLP